jgi:endonuclease YncB( thermonuclease family)
MCLKCSITDWNFACCDSERISVARPLARPLQREASARHRDQFHSLTQTSSLRRRRGRGTGLHLTRRTLLLSAAALSDCSAQPDLSPGEQGRIARITDGDVLGLDSGLKVRLAEIEAPAPGYDGREDQPFAREARTELVSAAMGRSAKLFYGGLQRDSYGRAIAHVIATDETGADVWLNGYLARQGAARIRTYPDNARRARELLAFEAEARSAKRGLWSLDHCRIRRVGDLEQLPNFLILEAQCTSLEEQGAETFASITPTGVRLTGLAKLGHPDITLRTNAPLRLRGRLDTREGEPKLRLTHWAQIEMV